MLYYATVRIPVNSSQHQELFNATVCIPVNGSQHQECQNHGFVLKLLQSPLLTADPG